MFQKSSNGETTCYKITFYNIIATCMSGTNEDFLWCIQREKEKLSDQQRLFNMDENAKLPEFHRERRHSRRCDLLHLQIFPIRSTFLNPLAAL